MSTQHVVRRMNANARKARAKARKREVLTRRRKRLLQTLYKRQGRVADLRASLLAAEGRMHAAARKVADVERDLQFLG